MMALWSTAPEFHRPTSFVAASFFDCVHKASDAFQRAIVDSYPRAQRWPYLPQLGDDPSVRSHIVPMATVLSISSCRHKA